MDVGTTDELKSSMDTSSATDSSKVNGVELTPVTHLTTGKPGFSVGATVATTTAKPPLAIPTPPEEKELEKRLGKLDSQIDKAKSRSEYFDLASLLKNIADGSSSDIIAPLKGFLRTLEALTAVHPFIALAVIPFKAIVSLELDRRENDRRILALIGQMTDLMQHLTELPRTAIPENQREQLSDILRNMKETIQLCGNAVDSYYKSKFIGRIIKALSWREKFEEFAQSFADLKKNLKTRMILVIHTTTSDTHEVVTMTADKVAHIDTKLKDIEGILRRRTELEQHIQDFMERNGGYERTLQDDRLLSQLVKKIEGSKDTAGLAKQVHWEGDRKRPTRSGSGDSVRYDHPGYTAISSGTGQAYPSIPFQPSPLGYVPSLGSHDPGTPAYSQFGRFIPSSSMRRPKDSSSVYSQAPNRRGAAYYSEPFEKPPAKYGPQAASANNDAFSNYSSYEPMQRPGTPYNSIPGVVEPDGPHNPFSPFIPPVIPIPSFSPTWYNGLDPSSQPLPGPFPPDAASYSTTQGYREYADSASQMLPPRDPRLRPASLPQALTPYGQRTPLPSATITLQKPEGKIIDPFGSVHRSLLVQYRSEIRIALATSVEVILTRNIHIWEITVLRFEVEIKSHIDRSTERVIEEIKKGPYTKIKDPTLRQIWETEKWSGSISGDLFHQSVYDHFSEQIETDPAGEIASDAWALEFLTISYRSTLVYAIDHDYSGFISISEANRFTQANPHDYSLLVWFAYSAVVWSYQANECRSTILELRAKLSYGLRSYDFSAETRYAVQAFEANITLEVDGVLLQSLHISQRRIQEMRRNERITGLLVDGLSAYREDLTRKLQAAHWEISSRSTLLAIAGDGPIENSIIVLLALTIDMFVDRLELNRGGLSSSEIYAPSEALSQLLGAVDERVSYLRDSFGPAKLDQFACGLFSQWIPKEFPEESNLPERGYLTQSPAQVHADTSSISADASSAIPAVSLSGGNGNEIDEEESGEGVREEKSSITGEDDDRTARSTDTRIGGNEVPYISDRTIPTPKAQPLPRGTIFISPPGSPVWPPTHSLPDWGNNGAPQGAFGQGSMGSHPTSLPLPHTSAQVFARPVPSSLSPPKPFPKISIFSHLDELVGPPMRVAPLPEHDIHQLDWDLFIKNLAKVAEWNPVLRLTARHRVRAIRMLVDAWNHHFFLRRLVYVRLVKTRPAKKHSRRRRPHESSDSDSDSASDLSSEFEERASGESRSEPRILRSRRRNDKQRKESITYSLICEYVPPNNAGTGPALFANF